MPFVFRIPPVQILFLGSQIYFLWRAAKWGKKRFASPAMRLLLGGTGLAVYLLFFGLNTWWAPRGPDPTHMTLREALISAPFLWWIFSSTVAFAVVIVIALGRVLLMPLKWIRPAATKPPAEAPPAPSRRVFLEQAATAAVAAPFVAGGYGLLYGRLNLQTTHQPIYLSRLPKAFHGFRIAQLSDIHIGPYMDEEEIRKYVRIANSLKADLVALTGDFITFDPSPQQAVVNALSGLHAPYGVFGCMGNHDAWADAEDSLTQLFGAAGIHMLRQQRTSLTASGDHINLAGIDFANSRRMSAGYGHMKSATLEGLEKLLEPDTANVLLSHNPETFDRAAQLGVDLSLAGHTHGGQLALEFISPEWAPTRIVTPYVAGWFQQPGGQLYVNRGIGTIAAPMRVGAPPEISVLELRRA